MDQEDWQHESRWGESRIMTDFQYRLSVCKSLSYIVSGQPHNNWWWCRDIGCPLLADEHSLCTAPWSGTPRRMTSLHSRTMSPSDMVWKLGFSAGTSVPSALETLWQYAIKIHIYHYHYHFTELQVFCFSPCTNGSHQAGRALIDNQPHSWPYSLSLQNCVNFRIQLQNFDV